MKRFFIPLISLLLLSQLAWPQQPFLPTIKTQWAIAKYEQPLQQQIESYEQLIIELDRQLEKTPLDVELWVWSGILKSSLAGAKGGLGALPLVKRARKDFEHALTLDNTPARQRYLQRPALR